MSVAYKVVSTDQVLRDFEASFTLAKDQVKMFTPTYIETWIERLKEARLKDVEVSEEWVQQLETGRTQLQSVEELEESMRELQERIDRHAV